ncbi:type 2 periplasmic-binding domain-containing protein [Klebsiella quasipneumoniae]|uniref:hypothetical protein n=1 Tax=Klebsiella quasipneumoniae TaxID=1463165 RepID=UPI002114C44F|nr:hypothetical protein [Klebsiella quasipneumoniae]
MTPAGPLTTNISEALLTAVIRATRIALLPGWMVNQAVQRGEGQRLCPDAARHAGSRKDPGIYRHGMPAAGVIPAVAGRAEAIMGRC